jgi:hypothetical protein
MIWGMVRKRNGTVAMDAMLIVTASHRRRVSVTHAGILASAKSGRCSPPPEDDAREDSEAPAAALR